MTKGDENPKRQHVIPRVYLEKFAEQDSRITVFSKRRKSRLRPLPKDALIRRYYYSQPLNGLDNAAHDLETKLLGGLETHYPSIYQGLIEGKGKVDLDLFLQFLLMLRSRSPAFREAFELGLADYVERHRQNIPKALIPSPPEEYPDLWDQVVITIDPHRSITAMAHYIRSYARCVVDCSYKVLRTPKGQRLLTSDNPVIWFEKADSLRDTVIYVNQPTLRTRTIVPLNQNYMLVGRQRKPHEPVLRQGIGELSRFQVKRYNELQFMCAWDEVIGAQRIPNSSWEYSMANAPELLISHFDPDNNTFVLDETTIRPIREKHKYTTRKDRND